MKLPALKKEEQGLKSIQDDATRLSISSSPELNLRDDIL